MGREGGEERERRVETREMGEGEKENGEEKGMK